MIIDCARHAGVTAHQDLFPYMPSSWQKHFDRHEWNSAVSLATNHIRVSDSFRHDPVPPYKPVTDPERMTLVIPHQGLTVTGWADRIGARVYVDALNSYGLDHWVSPSSRLAMLASPHDPEGAAADIRQRAKSSAVGAVCVPPTTQMLGTRYWDPVFEACVETGLPLVLHYAGIEGSYSGTPPLSGSVHRSAFSRLVLMPHISESNLASMLFEGAFYRFPELQVLFAGVGFKWVPALMRRVDQEWRNFRADIPWLKEKPSSKVLSNTWFSSYPVGEAVDPASWEGEVSEALATRVVFASHAPFGDDTPAEIEKLLGKAWLDRLMRNGGVLLKATSKVEA